MPVSHQWLSWTKPDPANVHFGSIVEAAKTLMKLHSLDRNELFLWIECEFTPSLSTPTLILPYTAISTHCYFLALPSDQSLSMSSPKRFASALALQLSLYPTKEQHAERPLHLITWCVCLGVPLLCCCRPTYDTPVNQCRVQLGDVSAQGMVPTGAVGAHCRRWFCTDVYFRGERSVALEESA